MSISIISASTGNGHNAVMNTLKEGFARQGYNVKCYPSFYEDLYPSNRVLSNFYNLLQATSIELCKKYTELAILEGEETKNELYNYCYDAIEEFVQNEEHEAIICTTPLLNRLMIRYLDDNQLTNKIPFYVVVTDPYDPIYQGFESPGANAYFCANNMVKKILLKSGIESDRIKVLGYPVSSKFCYKPSKNEKLNIYSKFGLTPEKPILLMNSGAQGSSHYFSILKSIAANNDRNFQVILICGRNKILLKTAQLYFNKNRNSDILILPYVDNIEELLYISDACLTKAGANTVYECLLAQTPLIIDAIDGLLYQEKGIIEFLDSNKAGYILQNIDQLDEILNDLYSKGQIEQIKKSIREMEFASGTGKIVDSILNDISLLRSKVR